MYSDPIVEILLYFIMPLWFAAGFADWLCHRVSNIESTTGMKESLIHLLMFIEVGLGMLAALFLQVNSLIILLMIVLFFVHEATSLWDVTYATSARIVTPLEQHIHSFLEMIPLLAIICVISLHWNAFIALMGSDNSRADYSLHWKEQQLPFNYLVSVMSAVVVFELLPYLEELWRGWKANNGKLVPPAPDMQRREI